MPEIDSTGLLHWNPGNGRPSITIHHDGRVELGEDVTLDQASREFWEAVQQLGVSQHDDRQAINDACQWTWPPRV